jgi:hypothetical protein
VSMINTLFCTGLNKIQPDFKSLDPLDFVHTLTNQ